MSTGITSSQGWTILKQLASNAGLDGELSSADVEKIMNKADTNKDGKISLDEFKSACEDKINTTEDEYLHAFKIIARNDGDDETISDADLEKIINDFLNGKAAAETSKNVNSAGNAKSPAGSGNTTNANKTSGKGASDTQEETVTLTPNVAAVSFTGEESLEELQSGRSETLTALSEARTQKAAIESDPAVTQAKEQAAAAQQNYNNSLTSLEEKKGVKTETEQKVLEQKELKDANDQEIAAQEEAITAAETAITDAQSALDACIASEPKQEQFIKTETRTSTNSKGETETYEVQVPDTAAYAAAHSEWAAEKNTAEAELANAELELAEAEAQLAELEAKEVEIDAQIAEIIQAAEEAGEAVTEELKNVAANLNASYEAKANVQQVKGEVSAQFELDINQLQANLNAYTNAISATKANEKFNNLEDVAGNPEKLQEMLDDPEISNEHKLLLIGYARQVNPEVSEKVLEDNPDFISNSVAEAAGDDGNTLEEVNAAVLADLEAQMEQKLSEIEAKEDSLTGLGKAWNGIKGWFGGGTEGAKEDIAGANSEIQQLYEAAKANPTQANLDALSKALNNEPVDWAATVQSVENAKNLQNGTFTVNGQAVSQQDIAAKVLDGVNNLEAGFKEDCDSAGAVTKACSFLNDFLGTGTTQNMTQAQIDNLKENAQKLATTTDPQEFASLYKAITGQSLTDVSVAQLGNSDSNPFENSAAAEAMMDYEQSTETIKTTIVGVAVGIATAATGGLAGAVLIGAAATVGVGALDAATQNNGQGVGENLLNYAKTDMVKDALVGGLNGLTGKLGNAAGDKLVKHLAGKTVGKEVAEQFAQEAAEQAIKKAGTSRLANLANKFGGKFLTNMAEKAAQGAGEAAATNAMKNTLSFGARVATEFIDGALDGALANAGEYTIDAAAGENGNFTNAEGEFAAWDNLKENYDFVEMLNQMGTGAAVGGLMSAGMQEGMREVSKGASFVFSKAKDLKAKIKGIDTNVKGADISASQVDLNNQKIADNNRLIADEKAIAAYDGQETGLAYLEGQNDALIDANTRLNDGSLKTPDDIKAQIEANNQKIADNNRLIADEQDVAAYDGQETGLAYLEGQNDALAEMNQRLEAELKKMESAEGVDGSHVKDADGQNKAGEADTKETGKGSDAATDKTDIDSDGRQHTGNAEGGNKAGDNTGNTGGQKGTDSVDGNNDAGNNGNGDANNGRNVEKRTPNQVVPRTQDQVVPRNHAEVKPEFDIKKIFSEETLSSIKPGEQRRFIMNGKVYWLKNVDGDVKFAALADLNNPNIITKPRTNYDAPVDSSSVLSLLNRLQQFSTLPEDVDFTKILNSFVGRGKVTNGKVSSELFDDLLKLEWAYSNGFGDQLEDVFVPKFSSASDAVSILKTGDVCSVKGMDNMGIKLADGSIKELGISSELYMQLFPPVSRFVTHQGGIGDCFLISSLDVLYRTPETRIKLLSAFSTNADGSISVQAGTFKKSFSLDGFSEARLQDAIKLKNGQFMLFDDVAVSSCNGMKMLEEACGYTLLYKKANSLVNNLKNYTPGTSEYNAIKQQIDYLMNNNIDEYQRMYEVLNMGGRGRTVFELFGFENITEGPIKETNLQFLSDIDSMNDYVITAGINGRSHDIAIDSSLGLYEKHMYGVVPYIDQQNNCLMFKISNPWATEVNLNFTYEEFIKYFDVIMVAKK